MRSGCYVQSAISLLEYCSGNIRLQSISIRVMCIILLPLIVLPYSRSGESDDLAKSPPQVREPSMQK